MIEKIKRTEKDKEKNEEEIAGEYPGCQYCGFPPGYHHESCSVGRREMEEKRKTQRLMSDEEWFEERKQNQFSEDE